MTGFERGLDRLVGRLMKLCEYMTIVIGIWLMCALVAAVFFRYVLNSSLTWVDESSSLLLVWLMLSVAPLGFHENFHIRVNAIVDSVPRPLRLVLGLFINACTALLFGIAGYYGVLNTIVELDAELFSIPLMRGWVTWYLPALSAVILLTTLYVSSPLEFSVFPSLLLGTTLFRLSELIDPFFPIQYCECLFHHAMHLANDTMIGSAVPVAFPRWFPGLGICRQRSDRLNFLLDPRRHHPSPLHQIVILNQRIWACGPPSSRAPQSIAECCVRCLCQNRAHKR